MRPAGLSSSATSGFLILTIGSVVFFTLLLVTGNTMAIAVRERTGELAVLKAIGFKDRYDTPAGAGGGAFDCPFRRRVGPGAGRVGHSRPQRGLEWSTPHLILSKTMLAEGTGFALLVGACSGLVPGIGAMRLRVVDAFRRV